MLPFDSFHKKFGTKAGHHSACSHCRNRIEAERIKGKRAQPSIYEAMAIPQAQLDAEREARLLATWDMIE